VQAGVQAALAAETVPATGGATGAGTRR